MGKGSGGKKLNMVDWGRTESVCMHEKSWQAEAVYLFTLWQMTGRHLALHDHPNNDDQREESRCGKRLRHAGA